jgi:hypothetical protein
MHLIHARNAMRPVFDVWGLTENGAGVGGNSIADPVRPHRPSSRKEQGTPKPGGGVTTASSHMTQMGVAIVAM